MNTKRTILILSIIVVIFTMISACFGLLYSDGGQPRFVENIYGEEVQLFGDGVYANNSMLKATTAKGTDLVMLVVSLGLAVTALKRNSGAKAKLIHAGLLFAIFYYSITTAFGVSFSKMFMIYVALFSVTFFTVVLVITDLMHTIVPKDKDRRYTVTGIFTIIAGCTTLV